MTPTHLAFMFIHGTTSAPHAAKMVTLSSPEAVETRRTVRRRGSYIFYKASSQMAVRLSAALLVYISVSGQVITKATARLEALGRTSNAEHSLNYVIIVERFKLMGLMPVLTLTANTPSVISLLSPVAFLFYPVCKVLIASDIQRVRYSALVYSEQCLRGRRDWPHASTCLG
jgi:hypothetical protein